MRVVLTSLFLLNAGLLNTGPAVAQPGDRPVDEIVTVAKRSDNPFEVVGNVAKLDDETLREISSLHIQEAIVRMPGVNLQQGEGQEYLPAVRSPVLTGAGACGAFLTMQDSIPLRAAGFCNVNELFEAYSEAAQRIEVVRGPGSAVYGSNAVHGVINILLPEVPEQSQGQVGLEMGENSYRREQVSYGTRFGDQGFLASVTTTHDGGFRDDAGYDQQKAQLRHEISTGDWNIATSFVATNLNQETAGYLEGKDSYKDKDLIKTNPNPEAYRDVQSFRLYSRLERSFDDDSSLVITPYARHSEMDFLMHFLPGQPLEQNGQDSAGLMLAWHSAMGDSLRLVSGLDTEITDGYLKQTQDQPTQGSAFLQATLPQGKQYDYQVDAFQVAPYIQADWFITPALTLTAGLRYELMDYRYDNRMIDGRTDENGIPCAMGGCRYNRPADRNDSFRNWSPKLGMLYRVNDNLNLFVNLARGFRAPQATELYRLQGDQNVADLDSEEIDSVELGIRGSVENFSYEANIYSMEKSNVIFQDSSRMNQDNGETEHAGVELELNYRFAELWNLGLVANYGDHTYSKNQLIGSTDIKGNKVDTAPEYFGTLVLGVNPLDSLRGELEYVYMDDYFTDPENLHQYDGHQLFNARMVWEPTERTALSLKVLNLTDRRYAKRADYTTFTEDRYFPGEPRSFYAGVKYAF